jgi:hypothetical protein
MSATRNGKIARLPRAVREQLNRRLRDGEEGKKLVAWLNGLPEVKAVVAAEFGGKPIREQNLSEWKKRGYRDWVAHQEALELAGRLAEDAIDWDTKNRAPLTDTLALWLASRYAIATRRVVEAKGTESWRILREMCADVVELRRGDHSAQRLDLDRERAVAAACDADMKWKRKVIIGLETLAKYVKKHPEAQAAFNELACQVRHPFDPTESESIRPNQINPP